MVKELLVTMSHEFKKNNCTMKKWIRLTFARIFVICFRLLHWQPGQVTVHPTAYLMLILNPNKSVCMLPQTIWYLTKRICFVLWMFCESTSRHEYMYVNLAAYNQRGSYIHIKYHCWPFVVRVQYSTCHWWETPLQDPMQPQIKSLGASIGAMVKIGASTKHTDG